MLTELFNLMVGTLRKEHGSLAVPEGKKNLISEEYEAKRETKQKKVDETIPLIEEEVAYKELLISQGFENWSRRDSQRFVHALETYGWQDSWMTTHHYNSNSCNYSGRKISSRSLVKLMTRRLQTSLSTIMFSGRNGIHSQVSLIIFGFHNSINLFNSYYAEYNRIAQRIAEGEAKRDKQDAL